MKNDVVPQGHLFIDGVWRESSDGRTRPTINPTTEAPITEIAQATTADVNAAVDAAHRAFEGGAWSRMGPHDKARVLTRVAQLVERDADQLAWLESLDMGKPIAFPETLMFDFWPIFSIITRGYLHN